MGPSELALSAAISLGFPASCRESLGAPGITAAEPRAFEGYSAEQGCLSPGALSATPVAFLEVVGSHRRLWGTVKKRRGYETPIV